MMKFDKFVKDFGPIFNGEGDSVTFLYNPENPEDLAKVLAAPTNTVWTVIKGADGDFITPSYTWNNAKGFIITERGRTETFNFQLVEV